MPTQAWAASDFLGLTPGVDARRSDKFFVLNGSNFVFDSKGPKSVFGNRYLTPYPLGLPTHVQGFRLKLRGGDRVFVFTGDSILEWAELQGGWKVIYVTSRTDIQPFRWTQGYLDGKQYFCHPSTGILIYDLNTGFCLPLDKPGMPNQPMAIVENNGRLCAIDGEYFYYSATSDGEDWVPRLGGPGFQKISDRVSGDSLMLTSYAGGTFTWTTGGVMKSEFTGDQYVFRHRALNTVLRPVNSFCTARIDNETVIVLDERGLFETKGNEPTPFSPLFNEYLAQYIQRYNLKVGQNLRIEWDELERRLYLSISLSIDSPLYESAFVLYPAVDKWGQFNESHHGILPLRIEAGSRADDFYGFVDPTGRVRYWNQLGTREILPTSLALNSLYPTIQKPSHYLANEPGLVVSSSATVSTVPASERGGPAGYYRVGGGQPVPATLTGLAASIQLGLISAAAFGLSESSDQLTEVTGLVLGNSVSGDAAESSMGFSLTPLLSNEVVGLETPNFVNCQVRVISTNDGKSVFQSAIPEIISQERGSRNYSLSTLGMYHVLELKAVAPGEAFQLASVSMTAAYAGKLA